MIDLTLRTDRGPLRCVRRSHAFTLVELLTVITIIGILAGLISAVAIKVRTTALDLRIKKEVADLALAIERVRTELGHGEYPCDFTNDGDTRRFMARAFHHWDSSNFDPRKYGLYAESALTFWLGGVWNDGEEEFIGFSANPLNPLDNSSNVGRIGPFFDFDKGRLRREQRGSGTVVLYYPPNNKKPDAAHDPYVYFKSANGEYSKLDRSGAKSFQRKGGTWVNPDSFQLLCPGMDGSYGDPLPRDTFRVYPDGENYAPETDDDITNFSNGRLSDDMPQ